MIKARYFYNYKKMVEFFLRTEENVIGWKETRTGRSYKVMI